jgi:hypothetical protein
VQFFEVKPHVGIGPLRLGMTPEAVRRAVGVHAVGKIDRGREEMVDDLGLNVDYSEGDSRVTFIQAFPVDGVRFGLGGLDVFGTPADDLVAEVVRRERLRPADFPPGQCEYLFPSLGLALWRSLPTDVPGWTFESISVHAAGYYEDSR